MCLLTTLYPITDTRFVRSASSGMHGSRLDDDRVTGVEEVGTVICYEFQRSLSDDTELITLYYGENVSTEEAEEVQEAVRERFPDAEVELNYGGQPVYYYFISAE